MHWTDNRLTIEWDRVADGVAGLRAEVEELYREGIDRSKLAQWGAAHDLVARYVPAASGSTWAAGVRGYADVEDPRPTSTRSSTTSSRSRCSTPRSRRSWRP